MDIKNIVKCLPEQFEELLRTGQVEVDGTIKKKQDGTLYDCGELYLLEWCNSIMAEQLRQYEISHTPLTVKSLEQEYEELIGKGASEYVSAVGYTALLRNGDTIVVTSPNAGDYYINSELVEKDYTYTGDGIELVHVWVFEGQEGQLIHPPSLNDEPTFYVPEINIKNIGQTPTVNSKYYLYANTIKTYNFTLSSTPLAAEKIEYKGVNTITAGIFCSANVKYFESDCTVFNHSSASPLGNKTQLEKAIFPELTSIGAAFDNTHLFMTLCSNKKLEIYFPKLESIANNNNSARVPFKNVYKVELPESVTYIGNYAFSGNAIIILNCNKATTINSNWCCTTPTVNFLISADWQADINIAVAAANHTKDWFVDLFANYLHDFAADSVPDGEAGETFMKEIVIPTAILDSLTEDELALAESKNWIVGGA